MVNELNQKTKAPGYVRDDVHMLQVTNEVLTSAWSEIILGMLENRIIRSISPRIQMRTDELFAPKFRYLYQYRKGHTEAYKTKHDPIQTQSIARLVNSFEKI